MSSQKKPQPSKPATEAKKPTSVQPKPSQDYGDSMRQALKKRAVPTKR